jgi:hypothetical protein
MNAQLSSFAAAIACGALLACGGSGDAGSSNPTATDAGAAGSDDANPGSSTGDDGAAAADAGPAPDPGAPSSTYPAFAPDFGQLQYNGGHVMKSATIVAITWNSDPSQASFDGFADAVGQTSYWTAASSEYGIGPAACSAADHVHMTTMAPAQMSDADLQSLVTTNAGKTEGWPAPTQDTIYAFFLPPGTSLQMQTGAGGSMGDACAAGIGGYHDEVVAGATPTSYAVVPSCAFPGGQPANEQTTMSMSHELLEAVTDPDPRDANPGWVGFDDAHFAFDWFQEFADENGDACEFFRQSFFEDMETSPVAFDYWVQRTWSNKAAIAGHDPCQPAVAGTPYFNVTPLNLGMVSLTLPASLTGSTAQTFQTKGLHIAVGDTQVLELGFYSDAPTSAPWALSYSLGSPVLQTKPTYLTVTLDKTTGQNGEKAHASVKVNSAGKLGGELVVFRSVLGGVSHYMPVVIGSM